MVRYRHFSWLDCRLDVPLAELRGLLEELWLKDGPLPSYPYANRFRTLSYLPHVYKLSEDNFTYHTVEAGVMEMVETIAGDEGAICVFRSAADKEGSGPAITSRAGLRNYTN